ncbi:MAG: hypothetical protein ACTH2Q_03775 [Propionibacteriaceae bacterium]
MDLGGIIAIVVAGAIFVTAAVIGIRLIVNRPKVITGTEPQVWNGPEGRTVDIPARQISATLSGAMSFLALGRYTGRSAVRITPTAVQTLTMRTKTIPYEQIAEVDVRHGNPEYVTLNYTNGMGLGVITSSWQAADAMLVELSRRCRLTPPAWHRIARFVRPPPQQAPPPQQGPPPPQGPAPGQAGWR